ncbi:MAG: hypothetical protein ACLUHE_10665 [Christensenellales bacterium]
MLGGVVGLYGPERARLRKRRAGAGGYAPAGHSQHGGQRRGGCYVAAAKSEASTKARESGGGMSAVREAAAKAEEEARAKAEELGIGAVDLTEIDTEPMSAALDVLLAGAAGVFRRGGRARRRRMRRRPRRAPRRTTRQAAGGRHGRGRH